MGDYEIECLECMWAGTAQDLLCSEDDDESNKKVDGIKFNICPECGESDCFVDTEDMEYIGKES